MTTAAEQRSLEWLKSADVRPTRQRLALAQLLVGDGENRHVCAESLHEAAQLGESSVSLATVYNTLRVFCDAGLMNEITVDGHKSYFDTRTDEHPHYYWENSSKVTDAPKDAVKFVSLPKAPDGTEVARIDVVIRLREK
ncbi:transcriptional repressor [Amylibacter ulvae]|uniref:Ferric uptake regulation protein n=1 Tax=Paramylibacter ulvae TaxID=1651968 RepID=A0ABQ3D168_9RHOB|nr:transcriptional repressor [Amylibacter ulvae]GHA50358.1 transcriptional repressor [Amylibacter ulvae]